MNFIREHFTLIIKKNDFASSKPIQCFIKLFIAFSVYHSKNKDIIQNKLKFIKICCRHNITRSAPLLPLLI
jgi:hypothetical protein